MRRIPNFDLRCCPIEYLPTHFMKHPLILAVILFAAIGVAPAAETTRSAAPNIVFIFADDWGWGDLSCHGHPWLQTPNLDRLAREGTDFQQFNVLNPVCS